MNQMGAELVSNRVGNQRTQRMHRPNFKIIYVSYKSPVFEKSNSKFAYLHGHNNTEDIQINFFFKASEENEEESEEEEIAIDINEFTNLQKGAVYKIRGYGEPTTKVPIPTYKALSFTKFIDLQDLSGIPPVPPAITRRQIPFCDSIESFQNQTFFNIIGRYYGSSDVKKRDENDDLIRSGDKVFFELSSGEITGVCLWGERSEGFNFQKGELVIFRWLEKPSTGTIGRYDLKCTFSTSILLLEYSNILEYVPQAQTLIQQPNSQETQEEDNFIDNQNPRGSQEEEKGQFDKGEFTIMAIIRKKGRPVYYPKCNGTKCSKKAKQTENGWTCGNPEHISQSPTNTLMLRAVVRTQKDTYKSVSFLGEMARRLLKDRAQSIIGLSQLQQEAQRNGQEIEQQQLDTELKKELKKVAGTLVQLSLEKVENEARKSFGWIVYEMLDLND